MSIKSTGHHRTVLRCLFLAALTAFHFSVVNIALSEEHYAAKDRYIVEFSESGQISSTELSLLGVSDSLTRPLSPFSRASLIEITSDEATKVTSGQPEDVKISGDVPVCERLLSTGAVKSCSPDYRIEISRLPDESGLSSQYWHNSIHSARAWDVSTGSENVVVAIIDTGVDFMHPDLVENMWHNPGEIQGNGLDDDNNGIVDDYFGYNAFSNTGNPFDDAGHGTHVAGIIGGRGNNGLGIAGVNWRVGIMALKFLSSGGWGYTSDAIKAIDYMVAMQKRGVAVRVANNSWGGGGFSRPLEDAIRRANDAGIIFAAAAGNSGSDNDVLPSYPASYDVSNVVSVAASDETDNLTSFSCFGAASVDIAAPGASILSTVPDGGYKLSSGTSMATPFVSGALALLLSHEPQLNIEQALQRLYSSAAPVSSSEGLTVTGRLLNTGNLLTGTAIDDPSALSECPYTVSSIPFKVPDGILSRAIAMPFQNSNYVGNLRVDLPFEFPFYNRTVRSLTVNPNGIVYLDKVQDPWSFFAHPYAPQFSIAPLFTYLYDYPISRDPAGIRVQTSAERVDIYWNMRHPWNAAAENLQIYLSLFPDGHIESFTDIPHDNLSKTLQYGSLIGVRGGGTIDALTVTQNGFPIPVRGEMGFRFVRPVECEISQRAPEPTVTPTPAVTPRPSLTPPPVPAAALASLKVTGPDGRASFVRTRETFILSLGGDGQGSASVNVQIANTQCAQSVDLQFDSSPVRYRVRMPQVGRRFNRMSIGSGQIKTRTRISGRKLAGRKHQRILETCSKLTRWLKRATKLTA